MVLFGTNPYGLVPTSLQASQILDTEHISSKAHKKLVKAGVLSATDNTIDTSKIDANFTHELSFVPAYRQKQIVDLLFWWEEECHRLRRLQAERTELQSLVDSSDGADKALYKQLLDRVENKISAKPSQRIEAMEKDEDALIQGWRNGTLPGKSRVGKQRQVEQAAASQGMEALP